MTPGLDAFAEPSIYSAMTSPEHAPRRLLSVDEYLRREERSQRRHEYVDGQIFAMTGTTIRHNQILHNVARRLHAKTADGPCRVFTESIKVRIRDERFYYPDVVVSCVPLDDDDVYLREPCLIVEVTSTRTKGTDRREKVWAYKTIPSLQTYLIVDHRRRHVKVHARETADTWAQYEVAATGEVRAPCIPTVLTLDEIYADVSIARIGERTPAPYAAVSDRGQ